MQRGIVTSAHEIITNGDSLSIQGGIPPEKLRYYLLYWDKIVITDSNIFSTGVSGEFKTLETAGLLEKQTARMTLQGKFNSTDLAKIHANGLAQIVSDLTNKNPGQWSIHQSGNQLIIPSSMSTELITADISLTNCLPIPKADFPLDKLLDFKLKNQDELLALRATLDELYLEITKSADIPRSQIAQIQRLNNAISDLNKVAQLSWGERILASHKVSLDLNYGSIVGGLVTSGIVGSMYSNPILGLFVGSLQTIASGLKFEVTLSEQLETLHGKQLDLSYLSSIQKENIVQ